jgi:hypothetical protein
MIVAIQGSRNFNDYAIFMRGIGVALRSLKPEDKDFIVWTSGPVNINEFVMEFMNVNERGLKARGIKSRVRKVPPSFLKENIHDIDYVLYFSKPKESLPDLVDIAEAKDVEVGIYRF